MAMKRHAPRAHRRFGHTAQYIARSRGEAASFTYHVRQNRISCENMRPMRKGSYGALDRIDRTILARLQEDARVTAETIATKVGLSPAVDTFRRAMRAESRIQQCYQVTGTTDL